MKNNNYTVVHSVDPFLLARLSTDLIMEGVKDDREWNDQDDELYDEWKWVTLRVDDEDSNGFWFSISRRTNRGGSLRLTLTEENYLEVLETILERHK